MESIGVKGKWFTVVGLILSLMIWWAPAALADDVKPEAKAEEAKGPELPTWNVGADLLSQYVWRGQALSKNSVVLQPSITGTYKGFSFNSWSNVDTNEQNPYGHNTHRGFVGNEMDLTASYTREVYTNFTLTGGLIYYLLDGNNNQFNSVEIYGGADYKLPWFNFGVNVYREVNHLPGTFLQWYIHRAIDIPYLVEGMNLDLLASWSAEFSNDKAAYPVFSSSGQLENKFYDSLNAGFIGASLNIPVGKYIVVAPKVQYWYGLGGQSTGTLNALSWDGQHNHILGGVNLTVNF
ncbi:MAG: TorF family putative porin [Desulfobaccales bacterium]